MASSAGVKRRAPRPRQILRQVGRDLELPTPGDKGAGVVGLVPAQRKATATCQPLIGHRHRSTPLGATVGRLHLQVEEQAIAVFRQALAE